MRYRTKKPVVRGIPLLMLWIILPGRVLPAEEMESEQCPERPEDPDTARRVAGLWFDKGAHHVDEKQYAQAEVAFRCSYDLVHHPATLHNLAKASMLAGHLHAASEAYRHYIEEYPDTVKTSQAKAALEKLERQLDAAQDEATGASDKPTTPSPDKTEEDIETQQPFTALPESPKKPSTSGADTAPREKKTEPADLIEKKPAGIPLREHRSLRAPAIGLLTTGLVGTVIGIGFGAAAFYQWAKSDDDGIRLTEFYNYEDKKSAFQAVAITSSAIGVTALIAGVTLLTIDWRRKDATEKSRLKFGSTPTGINLTFAF